MLRSGSATEWGKAAQQCKANANLLLLVKRNPTPVILFFSFSEDKFIKWTNLSDEIKIQEQYLVCIRMYPKLIGLE